ncbi:MAG: hypothetical protein NTV29_09605 [Planctomycetota bacterium]|nr:hypothetical protein [Planctomycetota bacterium]
MRSGTGTSSASVLRISARSRTADPSDLSDLTDLTRLSMCLGLSMCLAPG